MKKITRTILLLGIALAIGSCEKDEELETIPPGCDNSKGFSSEWVSEISNVAHDFRHVVFGETTQILFGPAPCDDDRGDFATLVNADGVSWDGNCAGATLTQKSYWEITCNILEFSYDHSDIVFTLK